MAKRQFRSVYRKFTPEEERLFQEGARWAREQKAELDQRSLEVKAQLEAAFAAMQVLKRERERRGVSLNDLAARTGIDKGNLSRLENDINANPTLDTLTRIARAIGGTLEFTFRPAA